MRLRHLQNQRAKRRQAEPLRNLMTQRTDALGNGAVILAQLSLAGNYQNQTHSGRVCAQDEMDQFRVRLGKGQPVQVGARLWAQLAALHPGMGARVHPQGGLGQALRQAGRKGTTFGNLVAFAQKERGQSRLGMGKRRLDGW